MFRFTFVAYDRRTMDRLPEQDRTVEGHTHGEASRRLVEALAREGEPSVAGKGGKTVLGASRCFSCDVPNAVCLG